MQAFWFGIIAILWAGFFLLEGFDYGVGMTFRFLAKDEAEREVALRTIGPVWDGNEVWLLVAGGATFAAFPEWYASAFSGFYLAFALLLTGLILRGIGIEYRGKVTTQRGRDWCDGATVVGSAVPALLIGVAFANFARGVEMNADHVMTGSFFDLLNPYALLGGLVTITLFALHGLLFTTLRTTGQVSDRANAWARTLAPLTGGLAVGLLLVTPKYRGGVVSWVLAVAIGAAFFGALYMLRVRRDGLAFLASSITTALVPIWAFAVLYPNVLPASNNSAFSLTIHNASSSPCTLRVMTVVALLFTPIVLAYQIWTYWVFRARVTPEVVASGGYGNSLAGRVKAEAQKAYGASAR